MLLKSWLMVYVLLLSFSCSNSSESEVKFLNLIQDTKRLTEDKTYVKWHLIHKVHSPITVRLNIVGGTCISQEKAQEWVIKAMGMWLDALIERHSAGRLAFQNDRPIPKDIRFDSTNYDFDLELNCKLVTLADVTSGRESPGRMMPYPDRPHNLYIPRHAPDLRTSYRTEIYNDFVFNVLVHELGHAFGVSDTYRYSAAESDPDNNGTFGRQPASMMSKPWDFEGLSEDDKDAMSWLYQYFVSKEIKSLSQCLPNYEYEAETGGCVKIGGAPQPPNPEPTSSPTPPNPNANRWCLANGEFTPAGPNGCDTNAIAYCYNGTTFVLCDDLRQF